MKIFFLIFLTLVTNNSAFALQVEEIWSSDYRPQLKVLCTSGEEQMCSELCKSEQAVNECIIDQKVCRDCVGTSLLVTNIFEGMGVRYRNRGDEVTSYELIDLLKSKNFVSFTSKSVYNHVDSYDSLTLQKKFLSLCPAGTMSTPVVFFDLKAKTNILNKVRYVACDDKIFTMSDEVLVDIGLDLKSIKFRFY